MFAASLCKKIDLRSLFLGNNKSKPESVGRAKSYRNPKTCSNFPAAKGKWQAATVTNSRLLNKNLKYNFLITGSLQLLPFLSILA